MLNSPQPMLYEPLRQAGVAAMSRLEPCLIPAPHCVLGCCKQQEKHGLFKVAFFPTHQTTCNFNMCSPPQLPALVLKKGREMQVYGVVLLPCHWHTRGLGVNHREAHRSSWVCDTEWKQQLKVKRSCIGLIISIQPSASSTSSSMYSRFLKAYWVCIYFP